MIKNGRHFSFSLYPYPVNLEVTLFLSKEVPRRMPVRNVQQTKVFFILQILFLTVFRFDIMLRHQLSRSPLRWSAHIGKPSA
jgi:hypothetical protein